MIVYQMIGQLSPSICSALMIAIDAQGAAIATAHSLANMPVQ